MSALGFLLRRHREDAGLTQEELAARSGLSARTVSDIERGVRSRVYADTADRLSVALALTGSERSTFLETARGRKPAGGTASVHSVVPRPLTPLLGRERELGDVLSALGARGSRLVTITGIGGVGKTRLGLAAAAELERHFDGRVHLVTIAPNQEAGLLLGVLARAVGAPERASPEEIAVRLCHPTLLVLDTFEHVLPAASIVESMLAAAPQLRVLATSRERLNIPGEQVLSLLPLRLPHPSDPNWSEAPAAALFIGRAQALRPDLNMPRDLVIEICERVSGVPLALELVAARVRHLPLAALRDRLRTGIADLTDSRSTRAGRHRSVAETLAWSTRSLTSEETLVLRVCAVFPGGWRLDAAQSLCGDDVDVVRAVSGLVDQSLVYLDESSSEPASVPRWRMLDVVREFIRGPAPHHIDAGMRAAFAAFFVGLLAEVDKHVGREREWFNVLSAEAANVRAALAWAAEDRDAETLLRLANSMWQFWQTRGELVEGRRWLITGLSLRPAATPQTRMTALWAAGWLAYHQADDAAAEAAAAELEQLARTDGDARARRNATTLRGMVAISQGDAVEAVALLAEALRIATGLESGWILATSRLNLGLGHLSAGDSETARGVLGEALAAYEEIGDERFHARCLGYLGLASLLDEDPYRARALFVQSLQVFRRLGEPGGIAESLAGIAAADATIGQPNRAAVLAGAAEQLRDSYAGRELPLDRRTNGQYLARAERLLGAEAWATAWVRGRDMRVEDAIDLALAPSSAGGPAVPITTTPARR
jgi:predicted ATPase/transcriptional regulator with XRE-family HTH domain